MNNFIVRAITGAAFVVTILVCIYFQTQYFTLSALFGFFTFIGLFEFYRMVNKSEQIQTPSLYLLFMGLVLYLSFLFYAITASYIPFLFYILLVVALVIAELYRKKSEPIHNLAFSIAGQVMVALPFGLLNIISASQDNIPFIWALFVLIWVSDTGAYLSGMTFGKHKLFERISPKKTWEGFIGGVLFVLIGAVVFWYIFPQIVLWQWLVFALIIITFGTFGDLSESLLKRSVNVKDSGSILPGHGGVLDRFDSLLLAIPVVFVFLSLIR